jgi:flagellar export protein FliJ
MEGPRSCWAALEDKAQRRITELQAEIAQAGQLLETLDASRIRLLTLYHEYRDQLQSRTEQLGMQEAMNQRQFMSQLQTLHNRVEADIERTMAHRAVLQTSLREADTERLKMKTLRENAQALHNKEVARQEQHAMDALGVQQYNRKAA